MITQGIKPIGYAVRMEDGFFVGIWEDEELAKRMCSLQPKGHRDYVIPVYSEEALLRQAHEITARFTASDMG